MTKTDSKLAYSKKALDKRKKENFPVASLLVPKRYRSSIISFYNFARHADDIADDTKLDKAQKNELLDNVENTLRSEKKVKIPEWVKPYINIIKNGDCEKRHGLALISAFKQDVEKDRYNSWEELIDYCNRSAAPVGRSFLEIAGEWQADLEASDNLCNVLQILNHVQDLKSDYVERNRCYFPEIWFGGNLSILKEDRSNEDVVLAIKKILDKADEMIEIAEKLPRTISSLRTRAEIITILEIAKKLSEYLRKFDPLAAQVSVTKKDNIKCFLKGFAKAITSPKDGLNSPTSITKASKSSFYLPLLSLKKEKREAMMSLYAFCRRLDDGVDDAKNLTEARKKLNFWRSEIDALYSDEMTYPQDYMTRNIMRYKAKYNLKREYFEEILNGLEMDVDGEMVIPTKEKLELYCYRVASCVGLLSIQIFGYKDKKTEDFAIYLGKAMQIINILRDIDEDAKNGRIYLPKEKLEKYGFKDISPEALLKRRKSHDPDLNKVAVFLGSMAEGFMYKAERALSSRDRKNMKAALLMQQVYMIYLGMLSSMRWNTEKENIKISFAQKVKILFSSPEKKFINTAP